MENESIQSFKQTSYEPYDRHRYKLVYADGKSDIFETYEEVQMKWFELPSIFVSHIEVLDKKTKTSKKGFK